MIDKENIIEIIEKQLEKTDRFLVDISINNNNKIDILIDGDNGVNIKDCVEISKVVENSLVRDDEDFALNVSSPGIEYPLRTIRYFKSKIGKDIKVITKDEETFTGELCEVSDSEIEIKIKLKKTEEKILIQHKNIEKAHCVVRFKKK